MVRREQLQRQGYDGIRIANGGIWIAFEPGNVKSSMGNNGDFDSKNPDIRFSRGAPTDTPAFKAWFKDSRVVNAKGGPLVVYHGTDEQFSTFEKSAISSPDEGGFFFTSDREIAEGYGETLMKTYLSIQNPKEFTNEQWAQGAGNSPEQMKADGHDGYVVRAYDFAGGEDTIDPPIADIWVAFKSNQIKSATNNNGDYDPANPDIRFSRGEETRTPAFKAWYGDWQNAVGGDFDGTPGYDYRGRSPNVNALQRCGDVATWRRGDESWRNSCGWASHVFAGLRACWRRWSPACLLSRHKG